MKWTNQSSRPRLANKALEAIRELDHEKYKSERIVDSYGKPGESVTFVTTKFGIGHETEASNPKAKEIYEAFAARHSWTITNENVKALESEAIALLAEAKKHRTVVDERKHKPNIQPLGEANHSLVNIDINDPRNADVLGG